ncbi:molybdenum cofactor guanylyltransferase [Oecophyllibacter saccharovorans]|uniref:molybdenum cofactor guanylyltransferase n=1 Tax=Oecophyllibacter saccharovorans TaxID=2558360 RepID=UPI001143DD3A|nr:NTP transferase domain-containing protein [Oecophyllibacter saccharovorans]QDH15382.1 molybdenum cofactor guanylyltransferase [Oecophyllibacter saccharovorans]
MREELYGLVLSGGASTRMGRDKAQLDYGGLPQLTRAMNLIKPHVARAFVSVRPGQPQDPVRAAYPQIVDEAGAVRGPAAGLLAAHHAYPQATWLVLACDLPLLDEATLAALLKAGAETETGPEDWEAVAFTSAHDGLPEPLCTLWRPGALKALEKFVAAGKPCPRKALLNSRTCLLDLPEPTALANINTPTERETALHRLQTGS